MRLSTIPSSSASVPAVDAIIRSGLFAAGRCVAALWRQRWGLAVALALCLGIGFSAQIVAVVDALTNGLSLSGNWLGGVDPASADFLVGALQAHVA